MCIRGLNCVVLCVGRLYTNPKVHFVQPCTYSGTTLASTCVKGITWSRLSLSSD